jgi:hypothetical protein
VTSTPNATSAKPDERDERDERYEPTSATSRRAQRAIEPSRGPIASPRSPLTNRCLVTSPPRDLALTRPSEPSVARVLALTRPSVHSVRPMRRDPDTERKCSEPAEERGLAPTRRSARRVTSAHPAARAAPTRNPEAAACTSPALGALGTGRCARAARASPLRRRRTQPRARPAKASPTANAAPGPARQGEPDSERSPPAKASSTANAAPGPASQRRSPSHSNDAAPASDGA